MLTEKNEQEQAKVDEATPEEQIALLEQRRRHLLRAKEPFEKKLVEVRTRIRAQKEQEELQKEQQQQQQKQQNSTGGATR